MSERPPKKKITKEKVASDPRIGLRAPRKEGEATGSALYKRTEREFRKIEKELLKSAYEAVPSISRSNIDVGSIAQKLEGLRHSRDTKAFKDVWTGIQVLRDESKRLSGEQANVTAAEGAGIEKILKDSRRRSLKLKFPDSDGTSYRGDSRYPLPSTAVSGVRYMGEPNYPVPALHEEKQPEPALPAPSPVREDAPTPEELSPPEKPSQESPRTIDGEWKDLVPEKEPEAEEAPASKTSHENTRLEQKRQLEEAVKALMEREAKSTEQGTAYRKNLHEKYRIPSLSADSPRKVKWDSNLLTEGILRERHAAYESTRAEYERLQKDFFSKKRAFMEKRGTIGNLGALFKRDWSNVSPEVRRARIAYERASQELLQRSETFAKDRLDAKSFEDYKKMYVKRLEREAKQGGLKAASFKEDSPEFRSGLDAYIKDYQGRAAERYRGLIANRSVIRNAGVAERKAIVSAFENREQGKIEKTLKAASAWYQKQPLWKKVLLGTGVATGFGAAGLVAGVASGAAIGTASLGILGLRSFARATALTVGLQAAVSRAYGRMGDAVGNKFGERLAKWRGILGRKEATEALGKIDSTLRNRAGNSLEIRRRRQEYLDLLSTEDKIQLYEKGLSVGTRALAGAATGAVIGGGALYGGKEAFESVGAEFGSAAQVSEAVDQAVHESGLTAGNIGDTAVEGGIPFTGLGAKFEDFVEPLQRYTITNPFGEGPAAGDGAGVPPIESGGGAPPENLPTGPEAESVTSGGSATAPEAAPPEEGASVPPAEGEIGRIDVEMPKTPEFEGYKEAAAVITEDAPNVEGPHNAIHGLRELQAELRAGGYDPTNAPALVRHILETDPETLAKETGFYQPNEPLDSGIVHAGDKFEFTKDGVFRFVGADGREVVFGRETELANMPDTVVPDDSGYRRAFEATGEKFGGRFMDTIHEVAPTGAQESWLAAWQSDHPGETPPAAVPTEEEMTRYYNERQRGAENLPRTDVTPESAPVGPAETGIPSVDAVLHSGLWNAFQNMPARDFIESWPEEATSLRTQMFEIVRESGTGPEVTESLASYLERARAAMETNQSALGGLASPENSHGIAVSPSRPTVYETSNETMRAWLDAQGLRDPALIVDGGDFNARSLIANEYLRLNPGAVVFYETPEGPNLLQATQGNVSPPLPVLKPNIETYVAKRF